MAPVRGNGIQELEGTFKAAGWQVIKDPGQRLGQTAAKDRSGC